MGADKVCDINEVRRLAMKKAQAKLRTLKDAGIDVPASVFSDLLATANEEARQECKEADMGVSAEQMGLIQQTCARCAAAYTVKGESLAQEAGEVLEEAAASVGEEATGQE